MQGGPPGAAQEGSTDGAAACGGIHYGHSTQEGSTEAAAACGGIIYDYSGNFGGMQF